MIKRLSFNNPVLHEIQLFNSKFALCKETQLQETQLQILLKKLNILEISISQLFIRILPNTFNNANKGILVNLDIDDMWEKIFEKKNFNDQMFPNLEKLVHATLSLTH